MPHYEVKISNDTLRDIVQALTGRSEVLGINQDGELLARFEAEDLWDLAETVSDLKGELGFLTSDFEFSKPVEVADPGLDSA